MLRPISAEWPMWHGDAWQAPQARETRPLRHELALALYLEEQAARRASSFRQVTLRTLASALIMQPGRLRSRIHRLVHREADRLCSPPSARPKDDCSLA